MMAAILVCGAMTVSISLSSCEKANAQEDNPAPKVESTELIRTSQSWDGVELPDYLQGRPELVAVKYVFPVGQKLGWHHHPVMNYGVLMQGRADHHRTGRQEEGGTRGRARRRDGEHHPPRREHRHRARHPLHVLPLAEGHAPGCAASGNSFRLT